MKLSFVTARTDAGGRHNDRNFELSHSDHIDAERTKYNKYWTYSGEMDKTFREIELEFYRANFRAFLDDRNKRDYESGHKRVKSMKTYYQAPYSRPEDVIIQIGNIRDHVSSEKLWEIVTEYARRFDELYGKNCKILDMAMHLDEATPHIHLRRVWYYENAKGLKAVGQTRALEAMEILPPNSLMEYSKLNNPKITFTRAEKELIRTIAREHSIELEPDTPGMRKHLTVNEYKLQEISKDLVRTNELLSKKKAEETSLNISMQNLKETYAKLQNDTAEQKENIKRLIDSLTDYLSDPYFNGLYTEELKRIRRFSEEKQLTEAKILLGRLCNPKSHSQDDPEHDYNID